MGRGPKVMTNSATPREREPASALLWGLRMDLRVVRLLIVSFALLCTMGCSTTLHMKSGANIEGDVEHGDDQFVYIVLEEQPQDAEDAYARSLHAGALWTPEGRRGTSGRLYRVERSEIADVDYPGYGLAVAGTVMTGAAMAVGLAGIVMMTTCSGSFCGFTGFFGFVMPGAGFTSLGLALMIPGWVVYGNAVADAAPADKDDRHAGLEVSVAPIVEPTGKNGGMAATLRW